MRTCLERHALLVLGVSAERAPDAEFARAKRFGLLRLDLALGTMLEDQGRRGRADLAARTRPRTRRAEDRRPADPGPATGQWTWIPKAWIGVQR